MTGELLRLLFYGYALLEIFNTGYMSQALDDL